MHAWLHFHMADSPLRSTDVIALLNDAGVIAEPLNLDRPSGVGLVFFAEVTVSLCNFVQTCSRNGLDRLLAIATTGSALANGHGWRLLQAGAADVLVWNPSPTRAPFNPAQMVAARLERWQAVDAVLASPLVRNSLIGDSRAWITVLRQVVEVARFTDSAVLITGETGTGKELVARLIHTLDARRNQHDLVITDCTTIVPELSGSELFGHERGAFTGAVAMREGAFSLAHGGTLFLDEVGELPLGMQVQLLRAIQERTYKRVGSNVWREADFRLVCATNRDLLQEAAQGHFRSDLYYRLANWTFKLPALRERIEDVIPLARHFMAELHPRHEPPELDQSVQEYLLTRTYAGNVRDLRSLAYRIMYRHVGTGPITIGDIPIDERPGNVGEPADWQTPALEQAVHYAFTGGAGLKAIRHAAEEAAIRIALAEEAGNLPRAARRLGVTDRALQMRRAEQRQRMLDAMREPTKLFDVISESVKE